MKKLFILLSLISTPLFCDDFPSYTMLEANTRAALEKAIPVQKKEAINKLEEIIYNPDIIKSDPLMIILESRMNEREGLDYMVDEIKIEDDLSSIYVSWFHTDDEQRARDIYLKISSKSRIYQYYCSILYTKTNFHIAGCDIYENGKRLELNHMATQDFVMLPILPIYNGPILEVFVDQKIDYELTATHRSLINYAGKNLWWITERN